MTAPAFRPGFRLSVRDVIVLFIGAVTSFLLHSMENPLGLIVFFTLAHFFLFCNILRMCRRFELIWAAFFLLLSVSAILFRIPSWPGNVVIMLAMTTILTVLQMRLPSYHGIFWQRINPELPRWWTKKTGRSLTGLFQDYD
ncbi:MAG: hypothetical protein D3909_18560 [Candidatus Electrothrix sp. ATG1]|nr:hypothetical protein [Candidatus Electrothrix sp. ATG1]